MLSNGIKIAGDGIACYFVILILFHEKIQNIQS